MVDLLTRQFSKDLPEMDGKNPEQPVILENAESVLPDKDPHIDRRKQRLFPGDQRLIGVNHAGQKEEKGKKQNRAPAISGHPHLDQQPDGQPHPRSARTGQPDGKTK